MADGVPGITGRGATVASNGYLALRLVIGKGIRVFDIAQNIDTAKNIMPASGMANGLAESPLFAPWPERWTLMMVPSAARQVMFTSPRRDHNVLQVRIYG